MYKMLLLLLIINDLMFFSDVINAYRQITNRIILCYYGLCSKQDHNYHVIHYQYRLRKISFDFPFNF